MWKQLVGQLEHEVATAVDPVIRGNALKKMAQTYRERQIDPRRAIELYEEVVAANPDDDQTLKALMELYESHPVNGPAPSIRRRKTSAPYDVPSNSRIDSLRMRGSSTERDSGRRRVPPQLLPAIARK